MKTLYYSLIYPYFQYCIIVWGSTYPTNLNRLILLQKRTVRIVNKKPFDAHTDPLFRDLKFLKIVDIYSLHLGKLMYSYNNNILRPSFSIFNVRIRFIAIILVVLTDSVSHFAVLI